MQPTVEGLFKFLVDLMLREFYGKVIIRLQGGKVTHMELETRRKWRYSDLPEQNSGPSGPFAGRADRGSVDSGTTVGNRSIWTC